MNDIDAQGEQDFAIWNERSVIADSLRDIGCPSLAELIHDKATTQKHINNLLAILVKEAKLQKKQDVLDRLQFAGLIHGGYSHVAL